MADNLDDDIDAIIGKEDLELDEIEIETPAEEPKADDPAPVDPETPPADPAPVEPETPVVPETPEAPAEPEVAPAPLTKDDVLKAISDMRTEERTSAKELDDLTNDVLKQYYPSGLSNTLVDEQTGKELRSPQDVVDVSGGSMTLEEASKWLMNEQYKLDQSIVKIKDDARNLAETNANFRSGITRVTDKYKDVFARFPDQANKIYKAYMKQVRIDNEKDLVLSAPDIEEYYDLVMEPYLLAHGNMQASQPAPTPAPEAPPTPQIPDSKPSINDRLDESGDGGGGSHEADPNNADEKLNELFGE